MENRNYKSEHDIQNQVDATSEILGLDIDRGVNDSNLSIEDIKSKFPERYNTYLKLLRSRRNESDISQHELVKLRTSIQALNNLDEYISHHQLNPEERVLRDRQFTVFEDVRTFLEEGHKEGYVKLPTGVGKTVLFSQITEALGLKSLIVVPSKILVNQTGEKLEQFTDIDFGKYYQEEKNFDQDVTVITYPSLINAVSSGVINPNDYDLLILDEAHKALGEKTIEAIQSFDAIKLGFTATPRYSDNKHVKDLLNTEVHNMNIIEGVQEGLINRFKSILAYTSTDLSSVKLNTNHNYDSVDLEKAVNNEARNLSAVELYNKAFKGERVVAYCSGVNHARDINRLFEESGVKSAVISGSTKPEQRDEILDRFHSGEIKVLCNARVLIEGFDEPRATAAFNLHPTLSQVDAEQRGGRVLRLNPDNAEKWAYIIDFIDKSPARPMILFSEVANAAEVDSSERRFLGNSESVDPAEKNKDEIANKLSDLNIEGLKVIVDTKEIMSISKDFQEQRVEASLAPDYWLNANQISKNYNLPYMAVYSLLSSLAAGNPDFTGTFKNDKGVVYDHYHPDLVKQVVDKLKPRAETNWAPEGWITHKGSQAILGSAQRIIEVEADKYRDQNPDWFKEYKTQNHILEHYSPELMAILKVEFDSRKAPEGWKTASALRKEVKTSDVTIKKFVERYRTEHPDWIKQYYTRAGQVDFYHPELVLLIEKEYSKIEFPSPPDGWKTTSQLYSEHGVDYERSARFAENYRVMHPGWFGKFKTRSKVAEHYHPDLVKEILDWDAERKSVTSPPEGWITPYALALKYKHARETIIRDAEQFRTTNPEWFQNYKAANMITEHYHPELLKALLALYDQKP